MLLYKIGAALSLTLCFVSNGFAVTIQVVDQMGAPLSNAVVEFDVGDVGKKSDPATVIQTVAIMDQINKRFVPQLLLVHVGQRVLFPNKDNIRHHVYSFSPAKTFELKLYHGKPENPVLFDQPGVVILGCNIHDSMVGYIYVSDHRVLATNDQGEVEIAGEINSPIHIWHSHQQLELHARQKFEIATGDRFLQFTVNTQVLQPRDTFSEKFK